MGNKHAYIEKSFHDFQPDPDKKEITITPEEKIIKNKFQKTKVRYENLNLFVKTKDVSVPCKQFSNHNCIDLINIDLDSYQVHFFH